LTWSATMRAAAATLSNSNGAPAMLLGQSSKLNPLTLHPHQSTHRWPRSRRGARTSGVSLDEPLREQGCDHLLDRTSPQGWWERHCAVLMLCCADEENASGTARACGSERDRVSSRSSPASDRERQASSNAITIPGQRRLAHRVPVAPALGKKSCSRSILYSAITF
jgi:hypothetical protein